MDDEILTEFLNEATEFLDVLERDLVDVDGGKDPAGVVAQTFRAFHTLKGTAGFLGFDNVRELGHAGEDLLGAIREGHVAWTPPITDKLLEVLDALRAMVRGGSGMPLGDADGLVRDLRRFASAPPLDAPLDGPPPPEAVLTPVVPSLAAAAAPTPAAPAQAATPPEAADHAPDAAATLRVSIPVLDRLMNLVGELVLARNQLLCHEATRDDPRLTATSQRIHQLTAGLQEAVMKSRMQPIDAVLSRLPRVARDAAQLCGKQIRLVTAGRETELDKTLLEAIKDPLGHVVRNAVDHGIEAPDARRAAGKPAEGTISIRAFHEGGQVIVEIADDGGGVRLDRVRQRAIANGLVTTDAAARLSEPEVLDLLFRPGFSTAEAVTAISGRGVGMDVVRTNVERIGGSVELTSRLGQGTTIRMRVPLTLVIVPSLIVASGAERYAVPQASLVELVRVPPEREAHMVVDVQGTALLRLRGTILPLVDLARVMRTGSAARAPDGALQVVVLTAMGRPFGLLVDDVADTEEIVLKPLARQLQGLGVFSGATVRGDGRVALVLDVQGLARRTGVLAEGAERAEASRRVVESGAARRPYLVLRGKDDGRLAIALGEVTRLEEFPEAQVERVGGAEALQYRGSILPLVRLSQALLERRGRPRKPAPGDSGRLQVVVQEWQGRQVGLVVESVLDVVEDDAVLDPSGARPGVAGRAVIQGRITEVLDTPAILARQLAAPGAEAVAP